MNEILYENGVDQLYGDILANPNIVLHFDGGVRPKNPGRFCCFGYVLLGANGTLLVKGCRWLEIENATNNYSEYCGVGFGLKFLTENLWKGNSVSIRGDSQLVCNQLARNFQIKNERLRKLAQRCWDVLETELGLEHDNTVDETAAIVPTEFRSNSWNAVWLRREKNSVADSLCHLAWKLKEQNK